MCNENEELALFLKILGENIRQLRLRAGKDIRTVATETDIPIQDLIEIEAGRSARQNARYLVIFCKYYGVEFPSLFKGW
ncbi:helix-turn-helix domain-containing protein [Chitinophaga tropicalis]|uniref:HTH cro/C1-type domain-containing protein n=1 Tax=Chitinophaga tropicalis TaxID=2683588 RepID=A0A7K1TZY6_9BACT|nr:helix-turn-helix transcriptional regulator [Chitinophaga tropicalis]MVT07679.1 hypothetical protein [Chitinophaga tropicalis]